VGNLGHPDHETTASSTEEVLVVAARYAWPEYHRYHAYICQAQRIFRDVTRIAFYSSGQIQPLVPAILEVHDGVRLRPESYRGTLRELLARLATNPPSYSTIGWFKVMILSAPESPATVQLAQPVVNDLVTEKSGLPMAFTQKHRYVELDRLRVANTTSGLL